MEKLMCLSPAVFFIAAAFLSLMIRVAPWRSWRNYAGLFVVAATVAVMACAGIYRSYAMFLCGMALAVTFSLYCVCLSFALPKEPSPPALQQRIIAVALALPLMFLPIGSKDAIRRAGHTNFSGRHQKKEYIAFPAEILGLQTSVSGDTEGMVREEAYVPVKGDIFSHKIGLLKDETPRRIGGSVFVSVTRTCTEKTRKTVEIVADTEVMMESDEKAVMDLAKSIEDAIHGKLGLEHVGPFRLSVHQPSACGYVPLFTGGDGNYYARLEWHRMDSGKGFLRLLLRAVSKKAGTPYYEEAMAGKDAPTQDGDNSR